MKTKVGAISWNVVSKGFEPGTPLQKKLRQKITKLEQHLEHFPPDAVHLQIAFSRHVKRARFVSALTLRLPSNILRSEKEAADPITAFDAAVKTLLRKISGLKAELRHEGAWKHESRRAVLHDQKGSRFAPDPLREGNGPQTMADLIRTLLERNAGRLLRYIQRHIWHEVEAGRISRGLIEPAVVLDEVARQALSKPQRKPEEMGYLIWFYQLVRQEIRRRSRIRKQEEREFLPLEARHRLPEEEELVEGYEPEKPLNIIEQNLAPEETEEQDLLPDDRGKSPDEVASRDDLLAEVQKLAREWPRPEQEAFELYFVEGLELDELAMILGVSRQEAENLLVGIQARLRQALLEQSRL